jgi:hypothetical protein
MSAERRSLALADFHDESYRRLSLPRGFVER